MNDPAFENREDWDEADHVYGGKYGCDGLMGINYVCEIVSLSREDVDELIAERTLRTRWSAPGAENYKVLICRKSVLEYVCNHYYNPAHDNNDNLLPRLVLWL